MNISKAWLRQKILCKIACNYKCCNSKTLGIAFKNMEETEVLNKKYGIDINNIWLPQNGKCRYLKADNTGCMFGEDRPSECKLWPLEIKTQRLQLSNWAMQQCPKPMNYKLIDYQKAYSRRNDSSDWKPIDYYRYKLFRSHHNKKEYIALTYKIEDTPSIYIMAKDNIISYFGESFYNQLVEIMGNVNLRGKIDWVQ